MPLVMMGGFPNNAEISDQKNSCYWDGSQIAGTLTESNANGSQRMPDKENFNCVIVQGVNGDIAGTLDASYYKGCGMREGIERKVIAIDRAAFNQGQNAQFDIGIDGGNSSNDSSERPRSGLLPDTVGALCATDYKFPQQQQIEQGKYVIEVIK